MLVSYGWVAVLATVEHDFRHLHVKSSQRVNLEALCFVWNRQRAVWRIEGSLQISLVPFMDLHVCQMKNATLLRLLLLQEIVRLLEFVIWNE